MKSPSGIRIKDRLNRPPAACSPNRTPRTGRRSAGPSFVARSGNVLLAGLSLLGILATLSAQGKEDAIRCANLIYGGSHTSRCFSHEFLSAVQRETAIPTERRFKSVKLGSRELFRFPFVVMTGEKDFSLSRREREHLQTYLERGGFLLASAGCSSKEWDKAFRREIARVFDKERTLEKLPMDHPLFSVFYQIDKLTLSHPGSPPFLEALTVDGKAVLVYSKEGLNDTEHAEGCCCCGANELTNAMQVNMNILVYALLH